MAKLRRELTDKINDIPVPEYTVGNRFLNHFEDALLALERGDAVAYFNSDGNGRGYLVEAGWRLLHQCGCDGRNGASRR